MSGSDQMISVPGVVRALDGKQAIVEVAQGGCGRCHEEGGCGGQQLTQMFCSGPKTYRVDNTPGVTVGDKVVIGIASGSVRRVANFAYIFPLTVAMVCAAVGSQWSDGLAILAAAVGLVAAFAYVRFHSLRAPGSALDRPRIINRS